jgi:hypothetical protein
MKAFRLGLPLWSLVAVSAVGCSGDKAPARGQIMLALHTDMALPKDVSKVKLQVLTAGTKDAGIVKFDRTFSVGANGEAKIPATFAIVAPEGQSPTVEVRVIGIGGSKARTFSKVITTVPKDRIATLNMPIQWLCDGTAQTIDPVTETYENTCPPIGDTETACVAGTCQDVNFPEAKLPTFSPPDVFGGGKDANDPTGKCFDTVACFDPGFDVTPDAACRVRIPAPPRHPLNFALVPQKVNEGICGGKACYVPLDQSEIFGWTELSGPAGSGGEGGESSLGGGGAGGADGDSGAGAGGDGGLPDLGAGSVLRTVQLPKAICQKLRDGVLKSVRATASCDPKTDRVPVCGDWYSVAAQRINPETSTMTGTGMMATGCPEFKPGNSVGAVTDDELLDGTLQAAADLKAQSDELAKETFDACAGIVSELGGTPPTSTVTPNPTLVQSACTQAQTELRNAGGGSIGSAWSVLVTPGKCGVSLDQQATCEGACSQSQCSSLPSPDLRCDSLGGTCEGACSGECAGSRDTPVDCNGSCDGICHGTCQGSCILSDGTSGDANCGGWCTGNCIGSCAGTCAPSSDSCQGTCWLSGAECTGRLTDLFCEGPLSLEDCLGDCGKLCAARAALDQTCQAPNAEVFGDAPPLVRSAIDAHYWKLLDVIYRSAGVSVSGPLVSQLNAAYASDSATVSDAHARACLNAAQSAIANASASLSAVISAASQTATSVASGGSDGAVCASTDSESACVRCVKNSCCGEFSTCSTDPACGGSGDGVGEFACVSDCYQTGPGNADVCEQGTACRTSASATFSPATSNLLACAHANCQNNCFLPICSPDQLACNGTCVNVLSDTKNCGGCGRACATGQSCVDGACFCPTGTTLCNGLCVNTDTDVANCGRCNALCNSSQSCVNGSCVGGSGGGGAGSGGGAPNAGGTAGVGGATLPAGGGGGAGGTGVPPTGGTGGLDSGSAGVAGGASTSCPTTTPSSGGGCSPFGVQCRYPDNVLCSCTADGWSCSNQL